MKTQEKKQAYCAVDFGAEAELKKFAERTLIRQKRERGKLKQGGMGILSECKTWQPCDYHPRGPHESFEFLTIRTSTASS